MTIKTDQKKQRRTFQSILNQRQLVKDNFAGTMGDGYGNLHVAGKPGYIYVTIGGIAYKAYCDRVAPQYGKYVWVGISNEGGKFYQVLSVRAISSAENSLVQGSGYAPAKRYEYMALDGGQDPLPVHLRAFTRLRIGMSATGGMNVELLGGFVKTSTGRVLIAKQDIDLTAQIPATANKAAYVLITIDDAGAVVQTKGSEMDINALANSDIPIAPTNTIEECGAVRVYYGQTLVREGRINTDILDTRFSNHNNGVSIGDTTVDHLHGMARWNGITGQTNFDLPDISIALDGVQISGSMVDPLIYALSDDGTQIVLDTALASDAVVMSNYLIAMME